MMYAIIVRTMTKSEIERRAINAAKTNAKYIERANVLIKDSLKSMALELMPVVDGYSGDPRTFRLSAEEKKKAQDSNTKRVLAIMLTYMKYAKNTAGKMNKDFGLQPADWDIKELTEKVKYDSNLKEYIDIQSKRAVSEVEVYASLGIKNKYTSKQATEVYFTDMDAPHRNREIAELAFLGYLSIKGTDILKPRKGGISSAYKSMMRICEDYMMQTFTISNAETWKDLYKYTITAGDSNVCQVCQDNAMIVFPASQFVVPAHNRCRCIEVPIIGSFM